MRREVYAPNVVTWKRSPMPAMCGHPRPLTTWAFSRVSDAAWSARLAQTSLLQTASVSVSETLTMYCSQPNAARRLCHDHDHDHDHAGGAGGAGEWASERADHQRDDGEPDE